MSLYPTETLGNYPCLRRFLNLGFEHNPAKDADQHGMICLESKDQRVFINPESGYLRFGRTLAAITRG